MLRGRFGDTTGRPYIEGRLIIPGQGLSSNLSFLVDTGADRTMLMPADARQMSLDYGQLTRRTESVGIGGTSLNFLEQATLVFLEPERLLHMYFIDIRIATPSPEIMDLPSLLGRDVLDRWRMTYDPGRGQVTFTVRSADQRIRVSG